MAHVSRSHATHMCISFVCLFSILLGSVCQVLEICLIFLRSLSLSLSRFVEISSVLFGISLVLLGSLSFCLRSLSFCWDLSLSLSLSLSPVISRQDKYLRYVRQSHEKRRTFSYTIRGKGPIQETY